MKPCSNKPIIPIFNIITMKKICYFIFFTILSYNYLMAQSTNTKGMVMYNFILLQDTVTMMGDKETESFLFFDTEKK
jgi:hypothetical protein